MSVKGHKIEIRRSELHTVVETVPLWEVPIIEAIHEEHGIKILEANVVIAGRDLPDAKEEFERLEARYRRSRNDDGSLSIPYVAAIYGQHANGVLQLKRAITEAAVGEDSLV